MTPTQSSPREFFELRLYHLRRGPMMKRFDDFFRDAALPAFARHGIGQVGVFGVMFGPDSPTMYVLIPHQSLESLAALDDRLQADPEYQRAGADFLGAGPTDPAFVRVESSLLRAFSTMPRIEVPARAAASQARIFELRTYESHSGNASLKKAEMFNEGEIALFRRTGLAPVFFGHTIVGTKLPNLAYMLTFENMAERERNWGVFINDPDWKRMSTAPGFTDPDILTNVSTVFLRPTPYSQI